MAEIQETPVSGRRPPSGAVERYPWHADLWAALTRDLERLPHALLLHGPAGLGKEAFAWRLAHSLVCLKPAADANACGQCRSCLLFAAGTHPDLLSVGLEDESRQIAVDQIRAIGSFVALRPHTGDRKVVVISPAQAMNLSAANSLLKVLEEPPAGSVLLLVTNNPSRLPATIRSRCAGVAFRAPPVAQAAEWLASKGVSEVGPLLDLAGGAPLLAFEHADSQNLAGRGQVRQDLQDLRSGRADPIRCAAQWKGFGTDRCLLWVQSYLAQIIRERMLSTVPDDDLSLPVNELFRFLDTVSKARNLADTPVDQTLLLEDLLIDWTRAGR